MMNKILARYGIKYIFVESSSAAILNKCIEHDIEYNDKWTHWVELSWGSGCYEQDEFDYAHNAFGSSFDEAFNECISSLMYNASTIKVARDICTKYNIPIPTVR